MQCSWRNLVDYNKSFDNDTADIKVDNFLCPSDIIIMEAFNVVCYLHK